MAEKLDPKETVTIEELLVTHMFEIAALIEILDRKDTLTKQEIRDEIAALRRKTPTAEPRQPAFPEPYLNTQAENALIDRIFELFTATGLTAHQAKNLLARVRQLIDVGERLAKKTSH